MMNEQVNLGELELLAKLLATEDLKVQHRPVETAYFDVKARELVLPMWKDLTRPIYHLMVCHEIGHALYTPLEAWERLVAEEPELKMFVNIVEDARIERLVKKLYPGSRRDFFMGYTQLKARDFFGIEKRNVNKMSLIDRINIHFKLGVQVDVEFTSEELTFVDMVEDCETFDEVVEVSRKIYEFLQQRSSRPKSNNSQEAKQSDEPTESSSSDGDDEADGDDETDDGDEADGDVETDEGDEADGDDDADGDEESEIDEFVSETMESMETAMNQMVDNTQIPSSNIYLEYPADASPWIIDYRTILSSCDEAEIEKGAVMYAEAMKRRSTSIETLTREFQMRKAAEGYSRAKLDKSGRLDPRKLASYTLTDDIFLRNLVLKQSKNHGVVMFVDFSGSMRDSLRGTFDQLLTLVQFCRKSSIPHRVYAFTQHDAWEFPEQNSMTPEQISSKRLIPVVDKNMRLLELFHEEMKTSDVTKMFAALYWFDKYPWQPRGDGKPKSFFILGFTPLAQTMFLSKSILNKFRKDTSTQVVTSIFLTDGDDSGIRIGNGSTVQMSIPGTVKAYARNMSFFSRGRSAKPNEMTLCNFILDDLRRDGFRTVGYRIVAHSELGRFKDDSKQLRKEGFVEKINFLGYDLLSFSLAPKDLLRPAAPAKQKPNSVKSLAKELVVDANSKKISRSVALGFSKIISGERLKA